MQARGSKGVRNGRTLVRAVLWSCAACAFAALACDNSQVPPLINGGPGTITVLERDGGARDASADRRPSGTGGAKPGGSGGSSPAGGRGGGTGGTGGVHSGGAAGSGNGGAAAGGAAGGGPPDDPCTACEKAKCTHPRGFGTDLTDAHNGLAAAMQVCFGGGPWPATLAAADTFCAAGLPSETGALAAAGDSANMPKTTLCQALLSCIHRTNCTQEPDVGNDLGCYCGDDVSPQVCLGPTFTPTGKCVAEFTSAMEADQLTQTNSGYITDLCLASGAALDINLWCDSNCCVEECLGVPLIGNEDLTYCGPVAATGGSTGSGGLAGTGGAAGARATGGAPGSGGAMASGGTPGTGGLAATGGAPGTGGLAATGGTPGTGGSPATAGASGTGSSPAPTSLANGSFDAGTAGWAPGVGITLGRSTNDVGASSQSGSLDVVMSGDPSLAQQAGAAQCLSIAAGATVKAQAAVLVPGQTATQASVNLWFYESADCSGSIAGVFSSVPSVSAIWQAVVASTQAPAGARSVLVRLAVLKPIGQTAAEALFDNVSVSSP